jgi:NAD dependent epimerase/dehydratase family enzyme
LGDYRLKSGQLWIHISDVVGIFLFCIKEQLEGNFNTVAPNPVSQSSFISALAKALKRPHIFPPIPKYFIKMILGDMSSLVLDSHWVSLKKYQKKGINFNLTK